MKDCSTCKDSVHNNPELIGVEYKYTKCADCAPSEPTEGHISFGDQFEHPREGTWKILPMPATEKVSGLAYQFIRYLKHEDAQRGKIRLRLIKRDKGRLKQIILLFTKAEENILARCADANWGNTQSDVARAIGISKQAVNKVIKRVIETAPVLKPFI